MTSRPVVAFRTHFWSETLDILARKAMSSSGEARFVVLADETNGEVDVGSYEKVRHTSDFTDLKLPKIPREGLLWYNGDYPLYRLQQKFPDAAAYAMIEYDVSVNCDLMPVFDAMIAKKIDLVAHAVREVDSSWNFYHCIGPHFSLPTQAMIHAVFASPRAVRHMLARRKELALSFEGGAHPWDVWPFCEGFVPSAIRELPGARIDELGTFADLPHYIYGTPLHIADRATVTTGSLIHPVLSGPHFIAKRMEFDDPADIFDPASGLREQLRFCLPAEFIDPLIDSFDRKQPALTSRFLSFAAELGWLDAARPRNLARGKPADQSSVSAQSRFPETARDASGGNDGNIGGGFGFWTADEINPFWQVDLGATCLIDRIVVHNCLSAQDQCTNLAVLTSTDQTNWTLTATKIDQKPYGGADGNPHSFTISPAQPARHCRIQLIGHGSLHLDEIEVFGWPKPEN